MPAFALPSYYDGRIRLNLAGRERGGTIEVADYDRVRAEVADLIRACGDPATGESPVDFIEFPASLDPRELRSTQADLIAVWKGVAVCFEHPSLGRIGPVPYRRTGGHTGAFGMAYIRDDNGPVGDQGIRSAFDVVPTIIALLRERYVRALSGTNLLSRPQSLREEPPFAVSSGSIGS